MLRLILKLLRQKPAQPAPEALSSSLFQPLAFQAFSSFFSETCSYGYLLVLQVPGVEHCLRCLKVWHANILYNILNYDNHRCLMFIPSHSPTLCFSGYSLLLLLIQIGCNVELSMGPSLDH